jgi:hypothetical protein
MNSETMSEPVDIEIKAKNLEDENEKLKAALKDVSKINIFQI